MLHAQPPERWFTADSLRRAWLAIRRAGGGPGADQVTLRDFAARLEPELDALRQELVRGVYRPRPLRQVLVPKNSGGLRPLVLWALRDRVAQRALYDILAPSFEEIFLPCSFGFRPGLGVKDAIGQVQRFRDENRRWVVHADIHACFDEIDNRRLIQLVKQRVQDRLLVRYVQGWLSSQIFNSADGLPRNAGASQGNVLSPLLANIYLHEFDQKVTGQGLALARYADDFVICCRRKSDAEAALHQAQRGLAAIGLAISPHKTHIAHFDQGFEWLGYFFVRRECFRLKAAPAVKQLSEERRTP